MTGPTRGRRWTDEYTEDKAWTPRPGLAFALRALARLLPVGAGIVAAVAVGRLVGRPGGIAGVAVWWVGLTVVSSVTMAATDRLTRRLLPLAAMLKLSLAFPDRTPSRLSVALRAGSVRTLEKRVAAAKAGAGSGEPTEAATTVLALAGSLTTHDRRTRGHSERVRAFTDLLAEELGLSARDRDQLRWASLLHDIGKVKVSRRVLNKPGKPDDVEWAELQRHPAEGAKLVEPLRHWLGPWVDAVVDHHERWDGKGYPNGSAGESISYGGRIVAVADAFETITATRPYKRPLSPAAAREELARCAGHQFDPAVVRAFLAISVGKLRWAMGPLSWFGALPLVGGLGEVTVRTSLAGGQLAANAAATGVAATGVGTLAVGSMVGASATAPPPELPPPPAAIVAPPAPAEAPPVVVPPPPPRTTSTTSTTSTTVTVPPAPPPPPVPVVAAQTPPPPPPPPPAAPVVRAEPPPPPPPVAPPPVVVPPPPPPRPAPPPPEAKPPKPENPKPENPKPENPKPDSGSGNGNGHGHGHGGGNGGGNGNGHGHGHGGRGSDHHRES